MMLIRQSDDHRPADVGETEAEVAEGKVMMMMMMMVVTQHIPTMTKSHHGGEMSVMMKVGMCQCQKPTIHHDELYFGVYMYIR